MNRMPAQLISEQLQPLLGEVSSRVVTGEPLFPAGFAWRGVEYTVSEVIETWKETGPCPRRKSFALLIVLRIGYPQMQR